MGQDGIMDSAKVWHQTVNEQSIGIIECHNEAANKLEETVVGITHYCPSFKKNLLEELKIGELPEFQSSEDLFKKIKSSRSSKHEEDTVNSSEKLKSVVYHTPGDSVRQRAMEIIRENRIQLVPSLKHWSVVGSCGNIYVVTLFKAGVRNMTCTCVASALCSQILAAMYSID
ncbi:hypothetical protein OUZ56_021549 [Daphnia magna]|uniref:SWIM-type domain-containing protein n=1 Tax=Daphnia magna TaxID=35525 RepID=A0ABQ9ZHP6_9CRUS|nr:hypothetical protein OUZ56_021549 [Daphnia magna]